ncbi:MAG: hypothetical protein JSS32_01685 [Verrucomicrobia bacterium]|nr:hypothetical protein [Verrucomicrobiota bacterium]
MNRLQALLNYFRASDAGGTTLSSASKGLERELFIQSALSNIIAPPFRVGCGDITDLSGQRSGQLDIVIEYSNSVSFPLVNGMNTPRLYLAEGVCAVIEVKSDLVGQWSEVLSSHQKLSQLRRSYADWISYGRMPERIPHFAVGFRGWKTMETIQKKLNESDLDGILVLNSGLFCGKKYKEKGPESLYAFFIALQELTGNLISAFSDYKAYVALREMKDSSVYHA